MTTVTESPKQLDLDENSHAGAAYSQCLRYRYRLWRRWAPGPSILWVMANPSTATADILDPTIRRCVGFSKRDGFGALEVVNLYAWRSTDPAGLLATNDPIGPFNDAHIADAAATTSRIVLAWGAAASILSGFKNRMWFVMGELNRRRPDLDQQCLGKNSDGCPSHPLYLPKDREMFFY